MASDLQDLEQALPYEADTAKLGRVFDDVARLLHVADGKLGDISSEQWLETLRGGSSAQSQDLPRRDWVKLAEDWRIVSKTFHIETC